MCPLIPVCCSGSKTRAEHRRLKLSGLVVLFGLLASADGSGKDGFSCRGAGVRREGRGGVVRARAWGIALRGSLALSRKADGRICRLGRAGAKGAHLAVTDAAGKIKASFAQSGNGRTLPVSRRRHGPPNPLVWSSRC